MSTPTHPPLPTRVGAVGRAGLTTLIASQLLAGVGVASGVAVGGLLAEKLSGTVALAGLAQTSSVLGAGLWAIPLARLAGRRGRRWGLGCGYALATLGCLLVLASAVLGSVVILFVGLAGFGAATAAGLQARFAATEVSTPGRQARAMSVVLWATTLGSIAGPNLSELGSDLGAALGLEPLTGPYLFSLVAFAAAMIILGVGLRPATPPEPVEGSLPEPVDGSLPEPVEGSLPEPVEGSLPEPVEGSTTASLPEPVEGSTDATGWLASLRLGLADPSTRLAMIAITCSHTIMVGVMVMTPVHMNHLGFSLGLVGLVISIHIFGMYGASPVMGWLTDRVSAHGVLLLGAGFFVIALVLAALADHPSMLVISLALGLLGLGWSAGMIGGSSLLTTSVDPAAKVSIQGTTDAVMNLCAAVSAAVSGLVLGWGGYPALAGLAGVFVLPMVVLTVRQWGSRQQIAVVATD